MFTPTTSLPDLLSHLVRMPTVSADLATNRAALDWVQQQLHALPLHVKRLERNGVASLIATTRDNQRDPKLWLSAHVDVVAATPDLFEPKLENGRIIGRGTCDMKFAIAVYIKLLQDLPDLSHYDLGLMLTTDEEVGGSNGVGWLVNDQKYRGSAVLLPDNGASWELEMGSKGASFWKFTSHGRTAHGSRPWNGHNAIDQLYQFINQLRTHVAAEPCHTPDHAHHTLTIGSLQGGSTVNQVPGTAEALVDIRVTPGTTTEDVMGWVQTAQASFPGIQAQQTFSLDSFRVPYAGPVALFSEIAQAATGQPILQALSPAGSDAHFFAGQGIPVINIRPQGGDNHGPKEWMDIKDLDRYYAVVRQFVDAWAKTS